ncbi:carbamoyl phosphate synthase [Pseudonocardia sulfidoxydans NBRC 16205]|uniref:Carbamoyl phosphate synthase n=1 Tax=Pseudonocardia sulfidoxydans NBRC 16205 TaxID=1223511 RepID=A0A511DLC5_9PSEU|nr:ATP-grasp domain-containing protein [Pseudonocardia sulfidoxydans]GEL25621.1 carbamoyl phosphate synthase [Pseudonocardia sulfidoxydans NBRC 16205]
MSPVLVTGAGGAAGISVIRALDGVRATVAADCDPLAAGLFLAGDAGVVPRADDPAFVDQLLKLADRTGATTLVCTVAEELPALAAAAADLDRAGLRHWLPAPGAVAACVDKWAFAAACTAADVPAPATGLGTAENVPGPWIVKPRAGRGSRDVHAADDADDLARALARVPDALVQTRLDGTEFTIDALVDRDGVLAGAVPRWRLVTKAGISTVGRTFDHPELVDAVATLLVAVGLTGPACVQGFVDDFGAFTFTEINPRFSGGLPLSLAAGADLVGEYVRGVDGLPVRRERLGHRPGVTMMRHHAEVFTG